ncbi:unnamed protein product [Nyctereutes procyonoides]|uniref:(raccoon dog) hypothetical protein n=1 Tax=Nyctereutes procyonoides TaxID=34880 RepID=A0A811ZYB1_NYCPR|nr:unnamed protein product [Nyctereutes procyonoides]
MDLGSRRQQRGGGAGRSQGGFLAPPPPPPPVQVYPLGHRQCLYGSFRFQPRNHGSPGLPTSQVVRECSPQPLFSSVAKSKALKVRRGLWPSVGKAWLLPTVPVPVPVPRRRPPRAPARARRSPPEPDHVSQPNSERPAPASAASDWPPGGGAIVRRPNRSSVSHGLPWPRPPGRRRRRPDSSHWQTAGGPERGRAEQRRRRRARSSAAPAAPGARRPRIVPGPVAGGPGRASRVSTAGNAPYTVLLPAPASGTPRRLGSRIQKSQERSC